MKKSISNIGKALNKAEQKLINGGYFPPFCDSNRDCPDNQTCNGASCYVSRG